MGNLGSQLVEGYNVVHNVKQLVSLYFRFYKVTMLENTNATGERRM
jgi:hypothetical protein